MPNYTLIAITNDQIEKILIVFYNVTYKSLIFLFLEFSVEYFGLWLIG